MSLKVRSEFQFGSYLELYVSTDITGAAWSLYHEDSVTVGVLDLVLGLQNTPRLLYISNGLSYWGLNFHFLQGENFVLMGFSKNE